MSILRFFAYSFLVLVCFNKLDFNAPWIDTSINLVLITLGSCFMIISLRAMLKERLGD